MKIKTSLMLLAVPAMLIGCDNKQTVEQTPPPPPPTTGQDIKDKAVETKDEFIAATQKKMHQLDAQIDDLSKKSANLSDDAKVKADKALDDLRAQRAKLDVQFDKLKASSQDGWDKTKSAFSSAWDDVEKSYYDAKAKFQQ